MKVKVIPPGKPPRPTEVIAEGEKNLKWIVKEGMTSTSCDPKSNQISSTHSTYHLHRSIRPKINEDIAKPKQHNKEEQVTIYYILNFTFKNKNIPPCQVYIEMYNEKSSVY